jgi:serine/threonine-protein kinase
MSIPPGDPPKPEEGTVVIPAGQSGRPHAVETPPRDIWDEEATRLIDPPPPPAPPPEALSDVRSDLPPGTVLGNYAVGKIIARGGLGAIYDGVNIHNPAERVAIKTILPEPGMSERFGRMLLDEANALMRVRHDAVVPYRTYGRIAGTNEFYLVLEFIEGDTLNEFYRRQKLAEPELFSLARRLAEGLQASHEEGLVHRDVSPDNVLLQDGQLDKATLIDFGIAKIGGAEDQPDTQFAGKLSYAAPEQFTPGGSIGPWTDVYSLALLLIAAARAKPLPMGKTIEEAIAAREQVPRIDGVPERLLGPLRRMLEPHTPDRPQSMGQVIKLLSDAESGPIPASAPATPAPSAKTAPTARSAIRRSERPAGPPRERSRRGGWVSAVLALLIGGGAAGSLLLYEEQIFGRPTPAPAEQVPASLQPQAEPQTQPPPTPVPVEAPVVPGPQPVTIPPVEPPLVKPEAPAPIASLPAIAPPLKLPQPIPLEPEPPNVEADADLLARVAAVDCSLIRVDMTSDQTVLRGIWDSPDNVQSLADALGQERSTSFTLAGDVISPRRCTLVNALKPFFVGAEPSTLTKPRALAPTGSSQMTIRPDPAYAHSYVVWADSANRVRVLLNLAEPTELSAAIATGRIRASAEGGYTLTLPRYSADPAADSGAVILVMSTQPLPPDAIQRSSMMTLKAMTSQLMAATAAGRLRIDLVEYVQAPPA